MLRLCCVASQFFPVRALKERSTRWLVIGRYFCWGNTIFLIKLESIAFRGSMQRATTLVWSGQIYKRWRLAAAAAAMDMDDYAKSLTHEL